LKVPSNFNFRKIMNTLEHNKAELLETKPQ
jgi:hypothetical protein